MELVFDLCGSVSQLFHGPAPRSPLHRLAVRLRHSRSDTSTEYEYYSIQRYPAGRVDVVSASQRLYLPDILPIVSTALSLL